MAKTTAQAPTKANSAGQWVGRNIFVLFALLALVGAFFAWWSPQQGRAAEIQQANARITELQSSISALEAQQVADRNEAVIAATGQDLSRQTEDDKLAEEMLRVATTWDDGESYIEARDVVMRLYGISEDSKFMQVYLPGEEQGAFRRDSDGEMHFAYPGVNSRLVDFQATVIEIDGEDWSYFALVRTATDSEAGGTRTNWTAVTYTINGEEKIVDVMAYPSNQAPQESGA